MNSLLIAGLGAILGLLLTVLIIRLLLRRPHTRVLVLNWLNWSGSELPPGARQLVRHGRWIAHIDRKKP